jgi:hypothetical protein
MKSRVAVGSLFILVAVALLTSACGGKSADPGVANLTNAGSTTTTTRTGGGGLIPSTAGTGGGHAVLQLNVKNGAKFASCMRKNGVPNFPDPDSTGAISIGPSSGIDPGSPKFRSAQQICKKLLPNGGQPSPAQLAKAQQAALAFSKCMRAHGVTDFPDPTFATGGGIGIKIQANGGNLNPNDPTFQAAQRACQGRLGFPKGQPSTSAGGK